MIICIPTENENGIDSSVYGHFGSAPYFMIYNTVNKQFEILNNNESEHIHGQCNPVQPIKDKGVEAVVVAGMGARALMNLQSIGIKVFRTFAEQNVNDIVSAIEKGELGELTIESSCSHHNCH